MKFSNRFLIDEIRDRINKGAIVGDDLEFVAKTLAPIMRAYNKKSRFADFRVFLDCLSGNLEELQEAFDTEMYRPIIDEIDLWDDISAISESMATIEDHIKILYGKIN